MRLTHTLWAFVCLTSLSDAAPPTAQDVVSAIRVGLPELESAERSLSKYVVRESTSKNRQKTKVGNLVVHRSGQKLLLRAGRYSYCLADDTMFMVEKNKQTEQWVVHYHDRQQPGESFRKRLTQRAAAIYPLTGIDLTRTVRELLDKPTFQATSVTIKPDGNIDLGYVLDLQQGRNPYIETGVLSVSPKFHYIVVAKNCRSHGPQVPSPLRTVFTRTLDDSGGVVRCKSVKVVGSVEATGLEGANDTYEFSDYSTDPVDPAVFTLDYYKLPTPTAAPEDRPPTRRWPWWAAAGAGCVGLSVLAGWLARRRASNHGGV